MSGGSYNYLYDRAEPDGLEAMTARLAELAPDSAAARDTASVLRLLRSERLLEVWRAVEYLDSHDSDEAEAAEAISEYGRDTVQGVAQ